MAGKSDHVLRRVKLLSLGSTVLLLGNNALNFNQVKTPQHERG